MIQRFDEVYKRKYKGECGLANGNGVGGEEDMVCEVSVDGRQLKDVSELNYKDLNLIN